MTLECIDDVHGPTCFIHMTWEARSHDTDVYLSREHARELFNWLGAWLHKG